MQELERPHGPGSKIRSKMQFVLLPLESSVVYIIILNVILQSAVCHCLASVSISLLMSVLSLSLSVGLV